MRCHTSTAAVVRRTSWARTSCGMRAEMAAQPVLRSRSPCDLLSLQTVAMPRRAHASTTTSASSSLARRRTAPWTSVLFGRGRGFGPLRGSGGTMGGGSLAAAAGTPNGGLSDPGAINELAATQTSPVIFARRTPEERHRDELGVKKMLEVAKERANQGEQEDRLLRFLGYYGKKNQTFRAGSALYANVFYQSLNEEFYDLLGYKEKELLAWFLISTLHMWLTSVRLRKDDSTRAFDTRAYFADSFWIDVEEKLNANVGVNYVGMGKAFRQLPALYAHATLSLDKALKSGSDDQLGDALFRHIFFNRLPHQSHMTTLIRYVRQELDHLDAVPNNLLLHGYLPWGKLPAIVSEPSHQAPKGEATPTAASSSSTSSSA